MYTEEQLSMSLVQVGAGAVDDLSATGDHSYSFAVMEQVCLRRLLVTVTTATSGASDIQFKFRSNFGDVGSESVLGTVTVPDSAAVGDVYYKDISPISLTPGGELLFDVDVAATSGAALYGVRADLDPEDANNQSQMVESA